MAWKRGQSGNPSGRRAGRPNATTQAIRERIAVEGDPLKTIIAFAKGETLSVGEGDAARAIVPTAGDILRASTFLAGKLIPDAKDGAVTFALGKIDSPTDGLAAMARIIEAVGSGELTPLEGDQLMGLAKTYLAAWEVSELERRIAALEAATGRGGKPEEPIRAPN